MSTPTENTVHPLVYGFGNPLLDVSAHVPEDYLTKYEIASGLACLASEKQLAVYDDLVHNFPVEYIAGGAAQNTIRVCQWMIQQPGATAYSGCIGKDKFGAQLTKVAESDGVFPHYYIHDSASTGACAVLVVGKERSLIANLGAAEKFDVAHFENPTTKQMMHDAKVFYIESYWLTHADAGTHLVAKFANEHDKIFTMNLSAPFLIQVPIFRTRVLDNIPYMDYLFGNESEAEALSEALGWNTKDVGEIAARASKMDKVNSSRPRTVVFTQGAEKTVVAINGEVQEFPVKPIDSNSIVDTNGAGDAFCGGFISQLVQGKPLQVCVEAGHYAAGMIIQQSGCFCPGKPTFSA